MEYSAPELVVLGSASVLVMGQPPGQDDNGSSPDENPGIGLLLGLDD
jgi:hypothetical protein